MSKIKVKTILLCAMILLVQSITPIYASSHKVTQKFDSSWELCGIMWGSGTLLYIDNEIAFCLDSTLSSYVGTNSSVNASSIPLSKTQIDTLGLIAWYGYRSKTNPTNTDYFLTQNLIWEYLGTPNNYAKSSAYPTKASMRSKLDAIMNKVNNYYKTPSFHNKTYNINLGETLTLTDTNNVLSSLQYYKVSGATITKNQNTLKIVPDGTSSKIVIQFHKGLSDKQLESNFIVRNNNSQPISPCLSTGDPYKSSITINVNTLGDLQLAKKDPNGKLIKDVSFRLSYNKDMSNPIGDYTTTDTGTVIVKNLNAKKVYIQEINVPSYLKLDKTIYEKQLNAGILSYFTLTNEWNTTSLQLAKKDPDGKLIGGTTFRLSYNPDMSNPIGDYTTLDDGKIIVDNILVKDIYIQEISVPSHLKLDDTIYKKQLYNNITLHYYTLTNEWSSGALYINKKDNFNRPISNVTFELSYEPDMSNIIGTYKTDSNGKIFINNLNPGFVYIREKDVPDYFILDSTIHEKLIIPSQTTSIDIINNIRTFNLSVSKTVEGLASDKQKTFSFIITFDQHLNGTFGDIKLINGQGFFELADNQSIRLSDIPMGAIYTIREHDYPDYLTEVKTMNDSRWNPSHTFSGIVYSDMIVEFKNIKDMPVPTGISLFNPLYLYMILMCICIYALKIYGKEVMISKDDDY